MGIVGRAAGAECFAEMHRLRAVRSGFCIHQIDADDGVALRGTKQQADVGMGLVLDQLGLMHVAGPAVIFGQPNCIPFKQGVGGHNFGGKIAGHPDTCVNLLLRLSYIEHFPDIWLLHGADKDVCSGCGQNRPECLQIAGMLECRFE